MNPPNASPSLVLGCFIKHDLCLPHFVFISPHFEISLFFPNLNIFSEACAHRLVQQAFVSPLALEGAELVTFGEAEWLELRLEVDGLGCSWDDKHRDYFTSLYTRTSLRVRRFEVARMLSLSLAAKTLEFIAVETAV